MEAIALYIGFLAFSFVGAREIAGFLGEPSVYVLACVAFAGHITGAVAGMGSEKRWGYITGAAGLAVSMLLIVGGAAVLIGQAWPLLAFTGILASTGAFWLAYQANEKRVARVQARLSLNVMVAVVMVPFLAVIGLAVAVGYATGWWY